MPELAETRPGAPHAVVRVVEAVAARVRTLAYGHLAVLILTLVVIGAYAQSQNSVFLEHDNLMSILRAAVTTFIIGCAATFVFVAAGIDLSVGAVFALGAVTAGELMGHGWAWPPALALGVLAGAGVGLVNAGLVHLARVPPIIATLSTLYVFGGVALVWTDGTPLTDLPGGFADLGQSEPAGVPALVLYAVAIGVISHVLLRSTPFGYDVQALGGNARAALANGVRVRRVSTMVYALSGGAAALAGILYAARTGAVDAQNGGTDVTLSVVAAVLIGGTSLFGGVGSIPGTALGALLFSEINNALTVSEVNALYQNIILGTILALAVATDSWRRARAFRTGASHQ